MGRYRNISILAAAVFIQLIGLAVQVRRKTENEPVRLIRVWAITAVTPLEKGIVSIQGGATKLWHNYFYLRGVRQENRALQDKIQQMELEQVRLRQDAEQAHRLQALLGFKEQFIDKTVAAQVIGASGSEQSRMVYLDKGEQDGIKEGMAVISADGIVGKTIRVLAHTSQVLLINDQNSGVGTILEQSRLQGVLKGRPGGELILDKVMSEEDVKPGDRILTSGGDQIFPKGLPVGTVSNVVHGGEFLQVTVRSGARLNHLEEVLVITKAQQRDAESLTAAPVRAADILAQRLPTVPDKPEPSASSHAAAGAVGKPAVTSAQPGTAAATTAPNNVPPLNKTTPAGTTAASPNPALNKPAVPKAVVSGQGPGGEKTNAAPQPKPTNAPKAAAPSVPSQPDTGDAPQ